MTYADILILLKAGYTKDEIQQMDSPVEAAPAESPAAPQPEPAAEAPAPEPEAAAPEDPTQQILHQLTELIKSVQANNRGAAEMGASIIDPQQAAINTLGALAGIPKQDN